MKIRAVFFIVSLVVALAMSAQQSQPKYQQGEQSAPPTGTQQKKSTASAQKPGRYSYSPQFSGADNATIRTCMAGTYGNLPAGSSRPRSLPPALDKQLQTGAKVPAALQSRVQPLPDMCASRLQMSLPVGWSRALLGNHVLLLDPNQVIVDQFNL